MNTQTLLIIVLLVINLSWIAIMILMVRDALDRVNTIDKLLLDRNLLKAELKKIDNRKNTKQLKSFIETPYEKRDELIHGNSGIG